MLILARFTIIELFMIFEEPYHMYFGEFQKFHRVLGRF